MNTESEKNSKNIEVEIRSFISENTHKELLSYFKKEGSHLGEDIQETYYFDCDQDLRIQKNESYAKIWVKKGKLHDEHREEIELRVEKEQFETLERLFLSLGYEVEIKWFRTRNTFEWEDIHVMLDYTKGYGYIIELEKMSSEEGKDNALQYLKDKLYDLAIPLTPKEEFNKKYQYYKENWRNLTK